MSVRNKRNPAVGSNRRHRNYLVDVPGPVLGLVLAFIERVADMVFLLLLRAGHLRKSRRAYYQRSEKVCAGGGVGGNNNRRTAGAENCIDGYLFIRT